MADNNKRGYGARNPEDPVVGDPRPVRLRQSQHEKIDAILKERSFSGFVGYLIEKYFKTEALMEGLYKNDRDGNNSEYIIDLICLIGSGVNSSDVSSFLMAWLCNKPLPNIQISEKSARLYEMMSSHYPIDDESNIITHTSYELIDIVRDTYFNDKLHYYRIYKMSEIVRNLSLTENFANKWVEEYTDGLRNMAQLNLTLAAVASPYLGFATYDCLQRKRFQSPAERPQWVRELNPAELDLIDEA